MAADIECARRLMSVCEAADEAATHPGAASEAHSVGVISGRTRAGGSPITEVYEGGEMVSDNNASDSGSGSGSGSETKLRPHGHLFRQSTFALLAFFVPLFAVLYWLSIPIGSWPAVLVAQIVVTLLFLIALVAFLRTAIWVSHSQIVERGYFGRVARTPVSEIDRIVVLELYRSDALDTTPQLFILRKDGSLLLRMRGQFWSRAAMDTVARELGAPVVPLPEPMTLRDLSIERPELLYWFERRIRDRRRPRR